MNILEHIVIWPFHLCNVSCCRVSEMDLLVEEYRNVAKGASMIEEFSEFSKNKLNISPEEFSIVLFSHFSSWFLLSLSY